VNQCLRATNDCFHFEKFFSPAFDVVAVGLDLVVVDAVKEEGQALQVDKRRHDPVDAVHLE
jgi:hypothetical protein